MKLAVIAPPQGLDIIERAELGYHLVLAQELIRSVEYREFYRKLHRKGHFIIVDNGAAEHDTPPFKKVVAVADYVGADEIVLPDVICNGPGTARLLRDTQYIWTDLAQRRRFAVPQGKTMDEWMVSLGEVIRVARPTTIGVSKYYPGSRLELLEEMALHPMFSRVQVHILGIASNDPLKEVAEINSRFGWVRGVDSGAPIAWAQNNALLAEPSPERYALDWGRSIDPSQAHRNIWDMLQVIDAF